MKLSQIYFKFSPDLLPLPSGERVRVRGIKRLKKILGSNNLGI